MLVLLIQYTNKQSVVLKDRPFLMMLLLCRSVGLIVISLDDAAQSCAVSLVPRGRLGEVVVLLIQPECVRLRSFGQWVESGNFMSFPRSAGTKGPLLLLPYPNDFTDGRDERRKMRPLAPPTRRKAPRTSPAVLAAVNVNKRSLELSFHHLVRNG